ncbi:hypothetical protein HPB48_018303 [Haemaphysalis longicornis]|uniref:Uncharacterized protein n=1 Tax=Haemaphysalis longicornis TaxID=44386 RepID=A0A9J6FR27_HAELO|nr:hypothetical protein HPB48_018303 [Haemaphysalis longicornis]
MKIQQRRIEELQRELQRLREPPQPDCQPDLFGADLCGRQGFAGQLLAQQQQHHQQQQQQQQQQSLAAALALGNDANNNHQLVGGGGAADRSGSSARTLAYCQGKQPSAKTINGFQPRSLQQASAFPSLLVPKAASSLPEQFVLTKQPPDYDEATKQLNKARQAQMLPLNNLMPAGSKQNRPRSIKSKDVDDVLEILIKNGGKSHLMGICAH